MTRPSSQPMNLSELYRFVMALGFCAYDMLLYLDTHPDDAQALSYYNQCNELYNSAKKTYEERFEPLSAFGSQPLEYRMKQIEQRTEAARAVPKTEFDIDFHL